MSSTFKGAKLNYSQVKKQAYKVYKSVKHYRPYILKSRTKVILMYAAIRNVLVQKEFREKRDHWMTALQEYDLEIKPTKIVRGQGLCWLTSQSNDPENQQADWEQEEATPTSFVNALETAASDWYDHIIFFLHNGFSPETLDPKKCRALRLKSAPYQLIDNVLFRKNYEGVFLRCLEKDQTNDFLFQFHAGPTGGHFSGDTTTHKIIRALAKSRNLSFPCSV